MSRPTETNNLNGTGNDLARDKIAPFVHSIRVTWADCDPAEIAYTGRIPYFALEAIDAWWQHTTGLEWYRLNLDRKIGTPFVHMSLDFKSPITPRHALQCQVELASLGNSSITHAVRGYQDEILCFDGRFVAVFVEARKMKKCSPPADLLAAIEAQLPNR